MPIVWDVLDDVGHNDDVDDAGSRPNNWGKKIADCKALRETATGLLVSIGGTNIQRWLPKKCIKDTSDIQSTGDTGSLHITSWLAKKWDENDVLEESVADLPVRFENCVCLSASAKALLVQMPDGKEVWFPRNQIVEASDIQDDSDTGTLAVSQWIAKQKGLT